MNRFRKTRFHQIGKIGIAFGILFTSATHVLGQSGARAPVVEQPPQQKTYAPGEVYLESSRVFVYVGKTGFGHEHGVVGRIKQGKVQLEADQNGGQLLFDMASFRADTDTARQYVGLSGTTDDSTKQKVNANMLGSGVLDIRKYPTASFTIGSSRLLPNKSQRGYPQYRLNGKLTLHGVMRPVSVIADAEPKGGWIHLRGRFELLQTAFGITPFSKAFGAVGITDKLKIWGDLWIAGPEGVTVPVATARKK